MQLEQYNGLIRREKQLQEDMKNFIIEALKENGGRITYVSPDTENEELTLDDKYPVIATLWGKHGTYNIAITDVYLAGQDDKHPVIYADGIDQDTDTLRKEFLIYPEQFSDIMYFIAAPLNEQISKIAERLALKDLVDKYNKLPHEFHRESGGIKHEYHSEYWDYKQKHISELDDLYIRCSETSPDKHEINSGLMAIICELAKLSLIENSQKLIDDLTEDESEGSTRYTEEAQDEFNELYDKIEGQLWELMNFKGID